MFDFGTFDYLTFDQGPFVTVSSAVEIDVGGKAKHGRKRRRSADDELTIEEVEFMQRELRKLKKAKTEREREESAKKLEIELAEAARDDEAAEVIASTIDEAPADIRRDYGAILRDTETVSKILAGLKELAIEISEENKRLQDEDDIEVLMLTS